MQRVPNARNVRDDLNEARTHSDERVVLFVQFDLDDVSADVDGSGTHCRARIIRIGHFISEIGSVYTRNRLVGKPEYRNKRICRSVILLLEYGICAGIGNQLLDAYGRGRNNDRNALFAAESVVVFHNCGYYVFARVLYLANALGAEKFFVNERCRKHVARHFVGIRRGCDDVRTDAVAVIEYERQNVVRIFVRRDDYRRGYVFSGYDEPVIAFERTEIPVIRICVCGRREPYERVA